MINIYCVKWGTKYSSEHVNRLYESIAEHYPDSFEFCCLTEDASGLEPWVESISLPVNNPLAKWWNKMYLFDRTVVDHPGEKVFFDLDIILQNDITPIINFKPENCLGLIRTYWHNLAKMKADTFHVPHRYTELNSSIIRWNDSLDIDEITYCFKRYQKQILWYYRGIDNFFGHRNVCPIKFFPLGWVYSFNNGYVFPHDTERHVYRELPLACIFDSMGDTDDVKPQF